MLPRWLKRTLVVVHIILISIWIGVLTSLLVLLQVKTTLTTDHFMAIDNLLFRLSDYVLLKFSFAVAISGLLFSLFTRWGFFTVLWIRIKWLALVILSLVLIFYTIPAIHGLAALSDVYQQDCLFHPDYLTYQNQVQKSSVLQLTVLIGVVIVSVVKPRGKRHRPPKFNRNYLMLFTPVLGFMLLVILFLQYRQLESYRNLSLTPVALTAIPDGYYIGKANYGYEYKVGVEVINHRIENVDILQNRHSFYAHLSEEIKTKILRNQRLNIDGITGATTTSKILLKAVEDAIVSSRK